MSSFIGHLPRFIRYRKYFILTLAAVFALTIPVFFLRFLERPKIEAKSFAITTEERVWLREFFQDFLFEMSFGAYTLYGSKPVSEMCLFYLTEEDRKELAEYIAAMSPEDQKNRVKIKRYDFEGNYEKWKSIKDRFPIRQYLFGEFISPIDGNTPLVLFVNIEAALRVITENYEHFRRALGRDFNPVEAVFEVENRESEFWNIAIKSHSLIGMLFGFGKENSLFFEWEMKYKDSIGKTGEFFRTLPSKVYQESTIKYPTTDNFMLPIFGTYGLYPTDTALIEKYRQEQKMIRSLYKGKDEVDVALAWLTR